MYAKRLDSCPTCQVALVLKENNLLCRKCGFKQPRITKQLFGIIDDYLYSEFFIIGVKKALLKDQELELNIAFRADSLIPLLVNHYLSRSVNTAYRFPFYIIKDTGSVIGYRAVIDSEDFNLEISLVIFFSIIEQLYEKTKKSNLGVVDYIDFNLIFE